MQYWFALITASFLTAIFTPLSKKLAKRLNAVAVPGGRNIHTTPTPRLGGVAIFLSFFLTSLIFSRNSLLLLIVLPGLIIFLSGVLDDIKSIKPYQKLFFQAFAALVAISLGLTIETVPNLLGGSVNLAAISFLGITLGNIITLVWLIVMMNVVNLSDGLDGLTSGLVGISAIILCLISLLTLNQPELALLFAILAGSSLGFLPFNFYPAKIFMGDSGSMFLGLTLGILSIISGAKILAAVLVFGFPVLDFIWSILRRFSRGGIKNIFKADRSHLHHLLLDAGFSQREIVLFFYATSIVFGVYAIFGDTQSKLLGLFILTLITIFILGILIFYLKRRKTWQKKT